MIWKNGRLEEPPNTLIILPGIAAVKRRYVIITEICEIDKRKLDILYNIADCNGKENVVFYRHKEEGTFQGRKLSTIVSSEASGDVEFVGVRKQSKSISAEEEAARRFIDPQRIPTCKSVPQKGIESDKRWDCGRKCKIGEIVNLQNAEVTKMLDNKNE